MTELGRALCAILLALLSMSACARQTTTTGGHNPWTVPGVLRLGEDEEPDSLSGIL